MRSRHLAVLLFTAAVAATVGGCASAGASANGAASEQHHSPNRITQDEIAASHGTDLYSVIQDLRPNFLMTRGGASITRGTGVIVYLDNSKLGDVTTLRQITPTDVKEVQYFSASEATQRYGTGVPNGVILVIRK
jgi:pyruvoyl-dependent arginine decarboxylase (PvlArgDC)